MAWTELHFGKHIGKTLPQILFSDPDWFFWSIDNNIWEKSNATLKKEVYLIDKRSRSIKIPNNSEKNLVVEFQVHPSTRNFGGFKIIPSDTPTHTGSTPTF